MGAFFIIIGWGAYCAIDNGRFELKRRSLLERIQAIQETIAEKQKLSEKGQPNGYAPLNNMTKVPDQFLPDVLGDIQINNGCWDALNNIPVISSSIGEPGETFIVCVPGDTSIDGEDEWRVNDMIIFNGDLGQWIRVDSSENVIQSNGSFFSIVLDGDGPLFQLKKWTVSGDAFLNTTNDTLEFSAISGTQDTNLIDSGPGESLISDGIGPNIVLKSLVSSTPTIVLSSDASTVTATAVTPILDSGFTFITISIIGGTLTSDLNQLFGWQRVGNAYRITTISPLIISTYSFASFQFNIVVELSTATDPTIAAISLNNPSQNSHGRVGGESAPLESSINQYQTIGGICSAFDPNTINCRCAYLSTFGFVEGGTFAFEMYLKD